ncbi:MarR family transcriptional regulator [Microbacterium sp. zg.B48]|uniref:MarR family winged helix-turn-helix transcriptional regulator n=1 Tax=unclassified Microbacterium TaxID=2609290 RepID=UPI00214BC446|nr:MULTISPECIES: MarR family transcriptional regulator [unclassified Microbacterium]MCR2762908.1 MarR family transcriptional regulator [Microbacterium sp. zg.B48]MCR2808495.1 MarR family transcriptional regulator [Microbacterium sp. zg.B185]WIM19065.1 MarR family transcriptional regulator [Microbacterium sp. zg-B185]
MDGAGDSRESGLDSPSTASELVDDVSFLLARANALSLAAGNAALSRHGLRVRSYSVLALAASSARPSQRELAELLRLDPSQVVALVDELQTRGLVVREPDPTDRRANVVVATDRGRALHAEAEASARGAEQQLHDDLSAAERRLLTDLLRRLAFPARR